MLASLIVSGILEEGRTHQFIKESFVKLKPWVPRESVKIELGRQSRVFLGVTALLGPAYARYVLRLARIGVEGRDRLVEEYRRSAEDEGRFILAYRHPGDADPHLVFHVLTNLIRGAAPVEIGRAHV